MIAGGLLDRGSITLREREIVIDRTCFRCGSEYEWGVHVAFFASRAGLSGAQITSLTHGGAADPCWTGERDRLLIEAADALHDSADIGPDLWRRLDRELRPEQLLDLLMLAGWYHAISFTANATRVVHARRTRNSRPRPSASQTVPQPARAARNQNAGRKSRTPSCAGVGNIRMNGKVRKWIRK